MKTKDEYEIFQAFEQLRRSIRPVSIYRNPGMSVNDYDTPTSYARGRAVQILKGKGYDTIVPGKYLPAYDLVQYCELVPYTVDIYALQHHKDSTNVVLDELIVDIKRKKHDGLTIVPFDMSMPQDPQDPLKNVVRGKAFVDHANDYKKRMICSHYNIDPKRYVILDEEELYSKYNRKSTPEIEDRLFADKCKEGIQKSEDELYVELAKR
jgi:hypothetical protein